MKRKINSEIKYDNNTFKVKIGTTDKKSPNVIYLEIGTYITPNEYKMSYSDDIFNFEKNIKKELKNCNIGGDYIMVIDVADERITTNKKSYMELQLTVKSKYDIGESFKIISYCIKQKR